jgi:tetratricopeptide (TPR) repeat protein
MNHAGIAAILHFFSLIDWSVGAHAGEVPRLWADAKPSGTALCALYQLDRQYERAVQKCTEALHNGEDAEIHSNRGSAYLMLDQVDRALSDFDRAIQLEPDNAIHYYNRGIGFSRMHQRQKAIEDYSMAIRLRPDLFPAYGNRAREFELEGERDKAIEDYRTALRLAPALQGALEEHLRRLGALPTSPAEATGRD